MATYYANADTGDNANDGSEGSPWDGDGNLETVIGNLSDGDTLILQEATTEYTTGTQNNIFPLAPTTGITIKAETLGDATVGPYTSGNDRWEHEGTYTYQNLIFDGFDTQNGSGAVWGTFCINKNGNDVTLSFTDCKIINYTTGSSYGVSGPFSYSFISGSEYANCDYYLNLTRTLVQCTGSGFLSANTASSAMNFVAVNTNCTFIVDGTGSRFWGGTGNSSNSTITDKNCIYYSPSSIVFEGSNGTQVAGTYSCYYNATSAPSGTGNISSDPLFVDPDNGNYELQTTSPCVNTGTLV